MRTGQSADGFSVFRGVTLLAVGELTKIGVPELEGPAAGAVDGTRVGVVEELMQTSLVIESNGQGKDKLDALLREGYTVVSITANHGKSYNDFLVILEKN